MKFQIYLKPFIILIKIIYHTFQTTSRFHLSLSPQLRHFRRKMLPIWWNEAFVLSKILFVFRFLNFADPNAWLLLRDLVTISEAEAWWNKIGINDFDGTETKTRNVDSENTSRNEKSTFGELIGKPLGRELLMEQHWSKENGIIQEFQNIPWNRLKRCHVHAYFKY